ncbi:hypothetical protein NBRC116584_02260 [Hydrogenophaga sp. 5NK40-0174]
MAVLGILAAAILPLSETLVRSRQERALRHNLWEIRTAIDAYKRMADEGVVSKGRAGNGYPDSLQALVEGVPDIRDDHKGVKHYFLRRIPKDPFADSSVPAPESWRLRSYASSASQPAPGQDVYDIRSSSDALAIDGTTYAQW